MKYTAWIQYVQMATLGILVILTTALFTVRCTDADIKHNFTYGTKFRITIWGQNGPLRTWISTGRVNSERESDGWYFKDSDTGAFVRVSGPVSVEEISSGEPAGASSPAENASP